ncbi:NAD(P)-binding Rossmann-fold containing protein [Glarea lozoyensis ATCC 20868]|uniref:NAD(P)-binding Rossmann-fold containing protein n=2 Tax=Glarea lozoyensis TaxID=101852 RepID=S3D0G5_GLAL2|nr:NAD(P)-binding Rossmann-fold containing protein [Glarea lozoyensis ATCC 20868]EHK99029.1 putative protein fmp52, mitochondrial [Glarea lozoyensis 74030]EPE25546.1 NAD(P)-binding Rossmann-fold containing protein [Glarea lozoyensis ATCC 20868]
MTSTAIVGSTGLVGSSILSTLLTHPSITTISSLSRRAPSTTDPKLTPLIDADSSQWPSKLSSLTPPPSIFFSALGTTRAAAGSLAGQRAIDYDLNLSLAQAAKAAGVKTYVLISTSGASPTSPLAYPKMKGELEEAVKALNFEKTIILRPGLIVGAREESRPAEWVVRKIAGAMGTVANGLKDFWAQDAGVIAKAAVSAGLKAEKGEGEKVWTVGQAEIVRLGRTEWKV